MQRLVEAAADDEELVAEDRRAEVAALDVRDGGQVAPPTSAWQVVRDLYGIDPLITKAVHRAGSRFNRLKKPLEIPIEKIFKHWWSLKTCHKIKS